MDYRLPVASTQAVCSHGEEEVESPEQGQDVIWRWLSNLQVFLIAAFPFVILGGFVPRLYCSFVLMVGIIVGMTAVWYKEHGRTSA